MHRTAVPTRMKRHLPSKSRLDATTPPQHQGALTSIFSVMMWLMTNISTVLRPSSASRFSSRSIESRR